MSFEPLMLVTIIITILAIGAFGASLTLLVICIGDLAAVYELRVNGGRRMVAYGAIRTEGISTVTLALIAVSGALTLFGEGRDGAGFIRGSVIVAILGIIANSIMNRVQRVRLTQYLAALPNEQPRRRTTDG